MKIVIEFDSKTEPNVVGEYLRSKFFDETQGMGCYETFALNADAVSLPKEPVPSWEISGENDDALLVYDSEMGEFTRAELDGIIMEYYWDGDGFLAFILDDGRYLVNSDCKKRYVWESLESKEAYWNFKV
jgi:hypothetical protein